MMRPLLDFAEFQVMARPEPGDEVIQPADNYEPVVAAGPQARVGLQNELLLDSCIADLRGNIGNDEVIGEIGHAFHADTAHHRHVVLAVLSCVMSSIPDS